MRLSDMATDSCAMQADSERPFLAHGLSPTMPKRAERPCYLMFQMVSFLRALYVIQHVWDL